MLHVFVKDSKIHDSVQIFVLITHKICPLRDSNQRPLAVWRANHFDKTVVTQNGYGDTKSEKLDVVVSILSSTYIGQESSYTNYTRRLSYGAIMSLQIRLASNDSEN